MRLNLMSAAVAAVVVTGPIFSASAWSETLGEVLAQAYRKNPTLRAERARQRATDEQVPQAKSGWRPVVNAQATTAYNWSYNQRGLFGASDSKSSPATLGIQFAQPLFRGFRTVEGVKQAEANVAAGRQQLLAVEQDVLFRATQAYMNVIRDRQVLNLRKQNVSVLQEQAAAAQQRFEVGEVTRTDVALSRARTSQAQAEVARAMAQLGASVASYQALVGKLPGALKYPKQAKVPSSLEAAYALAQKVNPNILAAANVQDAAHHSVSVVKGELLPELSLRGTASATDNWSTKGGVQENYSIQTTLDIPIYEGGRVYSAVRQAKQVESQRRIEVIEAVRQVREGVANAWNALESAESSIAAARTQVSAAQLAFSGVREEYLVGSRTTIDVLNAQQELQTARIALVVAQRDSVVASYQLLGAIGKLTARSLRLPTPVYDAKRNFNKVKDKWIGTEAETVD
jgi:outer membrane protein